MSNKSKQKTKQQQLDVKPLSKAKKKDSSTRKLNPIEVIVLSIVLLSLALAALFFPYSHYLNDYRKTDFYWNDSLAAKSSFENIPDCYVCADTGKVSLFIKDSCKALDIKLSNGKNCNLIGKEIKALSAMFTCYSDSVLMKNPDTILSPIVEACKKIPNGGVYCCSRECKPAWVLNDEFPHYSFDLSLLDSILKSDKESLNALLDKYDNVYDFLAGERILSPVVYGYADRLNGKLVLEENSLDIANITDRLYMQLYDSLCGGCGYVIYKDSICKVENLRDEYANLIWCNIGDVSVLENKKLDDESSNTWIFFIVIFLNTLLIFCLYRLANGEHKNMSAKNQNGNIDEFCNVSKNRIAQLINGDENNPDNEKLNQLSILVDLFKDLSECNDETSLNEFLVSPKFSGFIACFDLAKEGDNFRTVIDNRNVRLQDFEKDIARYREYETLYNKVKEHCGNNASVKDCITAINQKFSLLANILKCNNGDELNAVFGNNGFKTIVTPKTICESAKLGIETFRAFVGKVDDQKTKTALNQLLDDFANCKSICDTLKTDKIVDSKEINRQVQEMKANSENFIEVQKLLKMQNGKSSWMEQFNGCCSKFSNSKKYPSDFVEFVTVLTGGNYSSTLEKVKSAQSALSAYREYLSTLSGKDSFDNKQFNDFVWTLFDKHADAFAAIIDCQQTVSSKKKAFKSQLDEATDCVVKFHESDEFFNQMYDLFVGEFIRNREKNKDIGWFFEHILNIAFHTTDFIAHIKEPEKDIVFFKNYNWMKSGFVVKDKNKFEYKDSRYSTEYSNLLYEWFEQVEVEHTKFLIGNHLLKP